MIFGDSNEYAVSCSNTFLSIEHNTTDGVVHLQNNALRMKKYLYITDSALGETDSDGTEIGYIGATKGFIINNQEQNDDTKIQGMGVDIFDCLYDGANTKMGFHSLTPIARPTITGSRGGNVAIQELLGALSNYGLIIDSTT
jgi:hypothetical protein